MRGQGKDQMYRKLRSGAMGALKEQGGELMWSEFMCLKPAEEESLEQGLLSPRTSFFHLRMAGSQD